MRLIQCDRCGLERKTDAAGWRELHSFLDGAAYEHLCPACVKRALELDNDVLVDVDTGKRYPASRVPQVPTIMPNTSPDVHGHMNT